MKNSCKTVELNGEKYVREDLVQGATDDSGLPFVIVRARGAGCHCGYLKSQDRATKHVTLVGSRRLWRWHGRTLSGLAMEGTDDPGKCKFGPVVPEIEVSEYCEIIKCTRASEESLMGVQEWVND